MVERWDLEEFAEELHERGGLGKVTPVHRLVRALWKDPDAIEVVPLRALRFTRALLAEVHGKPRIFVREGATPQEMRFLIGHELAHWALREAGLASGDEEEERAANFLGACIVAPRRAFREAVRVFGDDVRALAAVFGSTHSLALLRLGEAMGVNLALVRPGLVRVRGDEYPWPHEETLRSWARSGKIPPGIRKTRGLDGSPHRIGLVVNT